MSKKLMSAAHSRHTGGGHSKKCTICNPKKNKKHLVQQLLPTRTKVVVNFDYGDLELRVAAAVRRGGFNVALGGHDETYIAAYLEQRP